MPPGLRGFAALAVVLAVATAAAYIASTAPGPVTLADVPSHFTVGGRAFPITYLATDPASREAGLMYKKITNSTAMLFVFPSFGKYAFWMSHVNASLDIIWMNVTGSVGRVVSVAENVPGCDSAFACPDYSPSSPANWVLEVSAGFARDQGIAVGTKVTFS